MDLNVPMLHLGLLFCAILGVWGRGEDGYGIWHRTLTPFQAHACDNEELLLQCTQNTVISVHYVMYGRQKNAGHLCPGSGRMRVSEEVQCESSKGALQVIHRHCHKSTMCRLHITPSLFGRDHCPGIRKFVEVVYKCRPEEFLNKIVCQGSQMDLFCPVGQGLTIYSATYGTTRTGAPECGQPEGTTPDDCLIDQADETIRSLCSGRQNCSLMADDRTFGNPGCTGNKYLKIAYNCVEKELLLPNVKRSEDISIVTTSFPAWASGMDLSSSRNYRPREIQIGTTESSSSVGMQSDEVVPANFQRDPSSLSGDQEVVGFMSDWVAAHKHMTGNKEKLILYVSISLTVGFLVFVTLLAGRYVVTRLESRRGSEEDMTPSNEDPFFGDNILDHYDPPRGDSPPPPPPLPPSTSSFRKDSETVPKAPVNTGAELNHYFS